MLRTGGLAIATELAVTINIVVSEEVKEILIPLWRFIRWSIAET